MGMTTGRPTQPWAAALNLKARRAHACLSLLLLLRLLLPVTPAGAAAPTIEDLRYQLAVLVWPDAATVRVTSKKRGRGRLVAEVIGKTQGFIKLISGNHRERLQTEMIWRHGRLAPLVYREESWRHGHHALKEYRFDYARGRLSLWQLQPGKGLRKKWQTGLHAPVYDPLSAFYNCRLQLLGPTREGETGIIPGIPYPHPEAIEVRLGPLTQEGRQAMVSLVNPVFAESRGVVFAMIDARRVPQRVWTTFFGITIHGKLLPGGVTMPARLPGAPASEPVAAGRPQHVPLRPLASRGNQP
jgi:hypothetical protein